MMLETLKSRKTSDTVFLIGGGNSLNTLLPDPSVLDGKDIISINTAYRLFPKSILFFADQKWFHIHKENLKNTFKGTIVTASQKDRRFYVDNGLLFIFMRGPDNGISEVEDKLSGSNSGQMAINLAVLMGYKKIVLLGFDMDSRTHKVHWHDGHGVGTNVSRYDTVFIPGMKSIVPFQEKLDFKVYNINRQSVLKYFEFADLEQFL